jgi:hypothetical protein
MKIRTQHQIRWKTRNLARDLEAAGWAIDLFRSPLVFSLFFRGASPKRGEEWKREGVRERVELAETWRVKRKGAIWAGVKVKRADQWWSVVECLPGGLPRVINASEALG